MEAKRQAIAVDSSGIPILMSGNVDELVWLHSVAKPFQLLPILARNLDLKYGLTDDELVFLTSSHLAQPQHIISFLSIMKKTGLNENDMILPFTYPHGKKCFQHWKEHDRRERKRYHPCSGNHACIMLLQRELTGSVTKYECIESAAQREILQYIREYSCDEPILGTDNCGIPMYKLSLRKIAESYQRFISYPEGGTVERFVNAVHNTPVMIEGDGCIATVLCSYKNLFAKTGINHLLAIGIRDKKVGIAVHSNTGWEDIINCLPKIFASIDVKCDPLLSMLKDIEC